ncbi:hypothetical protein NDU88_000650 [Pleurodeles waltl]|uniref:Uncharacterized protein n=1 Tax=Pleurodeles waltl TaxID=8319 RepID=A0AAV7Q7X7_PLEWA|nr:hypothetical protein NDU88_000650 [Pleurodeles waltl]
MPRGRLRAGGTCEGTGAIRSAKRPVCAQKVDPRCFQGSARSPDPGLAHPSGCNKAEETVRCEAARVAVERFLSHGNKAPALTRKAPGDKAPPDEYSSETPLMR